MGSIIRPVCKCNSIFPTLYFGGGFMNFHTLCNVPTACYHCKTIFSRNIESKRLRCPKCRKVVYPFGELTDIASEENIFFSWNKSFKNLKNCYQLEDKKYKCPMCLEEELYFINEGMWD